MFDSRLILALLLLNGVLAGAESGSTKTIIFFGDSLTAGYGLGDPDLAFPGVIQMKIDREKLPWKVINAGLSGETTADGVRRVDWILRRPATIFVLELGANDALRGLPIDSARNNLQTIINRVKKIQPSTQVVLVGMEAPRNMGSDYSFAFAQMFRDLAKSNQLALVPFLLEGVGGVASLNQGDGLHPTEEGHAILAENVWKTIGPLLKEFQVPAKQ